METTLADKAKALQTILDNAIDNKKVFGTSFCIKYRGDTWSGASGNMMQDSRFFIASTTKLFITALLLRMESKGMISLNDKISSYLDANTLDRLHSLKGIDYSGRLTIKNLLSHTSGIPDYFQKKNPEGISLESELEKGSDRSWTFEEAVSISKSMQPLFIPDTKGKAHYSDTNFQLLGRIIENMTQRSIAENFETEIIKPLGLTNTYMYQDINDATPQTMFFKERELFIPKAMTSFGPDGGLVSTSGELMTFLEAFFNNQIFPKTFLNQLKVWNPIFFPLESGIGIHRFKLPWIFNPFGKFPELIGHSGLSGTLAYHSSDRDLYIVGTVNQIAYPDTSFRLAIKLINKF